MRNPIPRKRLATASKVGIYLTKAQSDVRFLVGSECRVHRFILWTVRGMSIM
jgi:hypothetical protein